MAAQTSYSLTTAVAYAGLLADIEPKTVISREVEDAAGIGFGLVVSRGTGDTQVTLGGDGTGLGITVRDLAQEGAQGTGAVSYDQYEAAAVLTEGYCWAAINTASASPGDKLYYDDTTGAIEAGSGGAGKTPLNATLETTISSSGQLGLIKLDSPAMLEEDQAAQDTLIAANTAAIAAQVQRHSALQATAASATVREFIAGNTGVITSVKAQAGAGAASGESLTVDVKINGTTCLTGVITLDNAAGTTVQDGTVDTGADDLAEDDIVTIVYAYTAGGGPTPIVNTLVTIEYN